VGRIFIQTQDRPLFRVAEEVGFGDDAPGAAPKHD
jgi:hypothetical protein